jgi:hypothetical protein
MAFDHTLATILPELSRSQFHEANRVNALAGFGPGRNRLWKAYRRRGKWHPSGCQRHQRHISSDRDRADPVAMGAKQRSRLN